MAIPVPTEDRTIKPKLWRATQIKHYDGDPNVIHHDAAVRRQQQETFSSSPTHYIYRALSPSLEQKKEGLKHVLAPHPEPTPVRKRPAHSCAPLTDEEIMKKLFPIPAGMTTPPVVQSTADQFASQPNMLLAEGFSDSATKHMPNARKSFPDVVAEQQARSAGKGDASLCHGGVRKVELSSRSQSTEPVAGFKGFGRMCEDHEKRTGLKKVVPFSQPWDPLGLKAKCNSGGHPPNYYM